MPAGVDEATWNRAKGQAEKQGKGKNWAYVMSIYKRMNGSGGMEKKSCLLLESIRGQAKLAFRRPRLPLKVPQTQFSKRIRPIAQGVSDKIIEIRNSIKAGPA